MGHATLEREGHLDSAQQRHSNNQMGEGVGGGGGG